jgi:hypothetical protein
MLKTTPVIAMFRLCSISAEWRTVSGLGSEVDVESIVWIMLDDDGAGGGVWTSVGLSVPTMEV